MSLNSTQIKAITKLLRDSDKSTSTLIEEQLGSFDIPVLNEINNEIPCDDVLLKEHFLKLLKKIKRKKLFSEFEKWANADEINDLEEGIFLVATFNNPLLNKQKYKEIFNGWAEKISKNLKGIKLSGDSTSVINEINHFLFMEIGLEGNKQNYYNPENSFVDIVLENKLGNPILLSVIYLIVTKKLSLPFDGVAMPAHFLVQYNDGQSPIFIDPFNQGEIITITDCKQRIKALKLPWSEAYLAAPINKQIILRVLQNLINIYHNEGEYNLKNYLEDYSKIVKA